MVPIVPRRANTKLQNWIRKVEYVRRAGIRSQSAQVFVVYTEDLQAVIDQHARQDHHLCADDTHPVIRRPTDRIRRDFSSKHGALLRRGARLVLMKTSSVRI